MSMDPQKIVDEITKNTVRSFLTAYLISRLDEFKKTHKKDPELLYAQGQELKNYINQFDEHVVKSKRIVPASIVLFAWSFWNGSPTGVLTSLLILGLTAVGSQINKEEVIDYINKNFPNPKSKSVVKMAANTGKTVIEKLTLPLEAVAAAAGAGIGVVFADHLGTSAKEAGAAGGATAAVQLVHKGAEQAKELPKLIFSAGSDLVKTGADTATSVKDAAVSVKHEAAQELNKIASDIVKNGNATLVKAKKGVKGAAKGATKKISGGANLVKQKVINEVDQAIDLGAQLTMSTLMQLGKTGEKLTATLTKGIPGLGNTKKKSST